MKKILLGFLLGILAPSFAGAQAFTVAHDTVTQSVGGFGNVHNNITNTTASGLPISWHVIASDFPLDWLATSACGICDACTCVTNSGYQIWNPTTSTGTTYNCTYGASATNDFHLQLDLSAATSTGSHWMTVRVTEPGGGAKNMTFIINKVPVGIANVVNANDVNVYPNPAHDEVNVVFNGDVKNIVIANIIGSVMTVNRVNGSSANLSLENMPSGIYLVKLINSQGNIVATKKFTKQ